MWIELVLRWKARPLSSLQSQGWGKIYSQSISLRRGQDRYQPHLHSFHRCRKRALCSERNGSGCTELSQDTCRHGARRSGLFLYPATHPLLHLSYFFLFLQLPLLGHFSQTSSRSCIPPSNKHTLHRSRDMPFLCSSSDIWIIHN